MGIVKKTKANVVATEAERARKEGRTVFAPMLNTPVSQSASFTMSGSISGWAEMIEAIESHGWVLTQWSVAMDQKGRPQAYPLFRPGPG